MNAMELRNPEEMMKVSEVLAKSGYFNDAKSAAQAFVKVLAGQELGMPSFASMAGIHIIHGKPSIGANMMAAAIKRSPKYDYRVGYLDDSGCKIIFYENGQEIGISEFTKQDASKAGTQNIGKYPKNMYFARAVSNGTKWYCPDLFLGAPVYTPEELGAEVDNDGNVIQMAPKEKAITNGEPKKPLLNAKMQNSLHERMASLGEEVESERYKYAAAILSKPVESFGDLTVQDAKRVVDQLTLEHETKPPEPEYMNNAEAKKKHAKVGAILKEVAKEHDYPKGWQKDLASATLGRKITTYTKMTEDEADKVIANAEKIATGELILADETLLEAGTGEILETSEKSKLGDKRIEEGLHEVPS